MMKWIFWLIVVWWLLSKLINENKKNNVSSKYNQDDDGFSKFKNSHKNKHLKEDAGDYVDYEEIN
jgi:hypothetical protein